jgi:hypothetical protein
MTTITTTYTSKSGEKYDLLAFDNSRLYSPAEVRSVKASQQLYYNAIANDKLRAAQALEESKRPQQLTEDEYFAAAKAKDDKRKAEDMAHQKRHEAEAAAKAAFLKTSPDTISICESSLHMFLLNFQHWASKKYTFVDSSIESIAPNYYAVMMLKGVK